MARNDITDGSNRAVTDPPVETVELATGGVVVYERGRPDAWIQAETATDPTEVR
jgi:hypothetical protein